MTIILGIDPGTIKCGVAILDGDILEMIGTFKMHGDFDDRLKQLWDRLNSLDSALDLVAIEMPPGHVRGRRADTGLKIGMGIGVVKSFAFSRGLPVLSVHHATAKKAATGNGRAKKEQVQWSVKSRFMLEEIEKTPLMPWRSPWQLRDFGGR